MRTNWLWFIVIVVVVSCTQTITKDPEPPSDLIQRDTMVHIIVDLRLMDGVLIRNQRLGKGGLNDQKYMLHNSILEKYNINRDQFERSFAFYQKDIETLDKIYADAIEELAKLKHEAKTTEKTEN